MTDAVGAGGGRGTDDADADASDIVGPGPGPNLAMVSSLDSLAEAAVPVSAAQAAVDSLEVLSRQVKMKKKEARLLSKQQEEDMSQALRSYSENFDQTSAVAARVLKQEVVPNLGLHWAIPCPEGPLPVSACIPGNRAGAGLDLSAVAMHAAWSQVRKDKHTETEMKLTDIVRSDADSLTVTDSDLGPRT